MKDIGNRGEEYSQKEQKYSHHEKLSISQIIFTPSGREASNTQQLNR
ncbi:12894_t:CDS:2 [Funneliformis mosseae]|uniref:12894_t:CDS:1 n=1 Tax=Funneliformis mosseae TaxID=27381 RepID=A0A9N8Z2X9_FUNMO|nr:12894_t:CDS:2 [Funneliformis mosseae]